MPYYVLGLDPGQAADPTAVALVEYDYMQQPVYRLRGLHRFPLGTPYTELPGALETRLHEPPLTGCVTLAVDATGVGAPVIDHFRKHLPSIPLYAITITAGTTVTGSGQHPHVPKRDLISTSSVILEQRRLQVAENMRNTEALTDELLAYRRTTTERGHDTYAAASGSHDDLVLALSLALWTAEHKAPRRRVYHSNIKVLTETRLPGIDEILAASQRRNYGWNYHNF
jgi:Terminase RNaseH-like domain